MVHAFVGLDRGEDLPVATNENGEFDLKVPVADGATLLASDGPRLGTSKIEEGAPLEIVLPDAPPIKDNVAFAEQVFPGSSLDWKWGELWNLPNYEALSETLVRIHASTPEDWGWSDIVHIMAEREPTQFLAEEQTLRARTAAANKASLERLLMLASASSKEEGTRSQVKAWLAEQERVKRDVSAQSVTQLLGIAEIAQQLDPQVGKVWLDYAAQVVNQLAKIESDTVKEWGNRAARISPQAVETVGEEWTPGVKLQLLEGAMHTYRARADAENARRTFAQMEKLSAQAEGANETITLYGMPHKPSDLLPLGREQLIYALAPVSPKEALDAVGQLDGGNSRAQAFLVVARSAVKRNELDTARQALNALLNQKRSNSKYTAQAAHIASGFDPALADTLFTQAFLQANPKVDGDFPQWHPSIGEYAKARASRWPGESRILLERQWPLWSALLAKQQENDAIAGTMVGLVEAMAYVAPDRAVEMAEQVPVKGGEHAQARGAIAIALLKGK